MIMWVAGNTVPSLIEGVETIRENGVQVLFVTYLEAHTLLIVINRKYSPCHNENCGLQTRKRLLISSHY